MDNPTEAVFDAITEAAEEAIAKARERQDEIRDVNWTDVAVTETLFCQGRDGGIKWLVTIEEASPNSVLAQAVYVHLMRAFPDQVFDVATEW